MKITCINGYFIFKEDRSGEIARFNSMYAQDLISVYDYYTFKMLAEFPKYSIAGKPLLGVPAIATFEGKPWDILEANKMVYDFSARKVMPILKVMDRVDPKRQYDNWSFDGLIKAGSKDPYWNIISGYNCVLNLEKFQFFYSDLFYATY